MAVSVHLLQLMYTQKKINFDKCSGANTFGHKWHKLIFQDCICNGVCHTEGNFFQCCLSRKSDEKKYY